MHRSLTLLAVGLLSLTLSPTEHRGEVAELSPDDTPAAQPIPSPSAEGPVRPVAMLAAQLPEATRQRIGPVLGRLPLSFEANQGQTDDTVDYLSRGPGYTIFLNEKEAVLQLQTRAARTPEKNRALRRKLEKKEITRDEFDKELSAAIPRLPAVRMQLVAANGNLESEGLEKLPGKTNYIRGNDPAQWQTNVPTFQKVAYREVYNGIDLVYYGNQRRLEYDFVVQPGADPSQIRLKFEGPGSISLSPGGDLLLPLAAEGSKESAGEIRLRKPYLYQEIDGERVEVAGSFVLHEENQVSFEMASYQKGRALVIDPVVDFATYFGGTGSDFALAVDVGADGSIYLAGSTTSADFPVTGAFQSTLASTNFTSDGFVTKLTPNADAIIYSTFIGGTESDTFQDIEVDSVGRVVLFGDTNSANFPTANPTQAALACTADTDATICALSEDGSELIFSTFLGGCGFEFPGDMELAENDTEVTILTAGSTLSNDFRDCTTCEVDSDAGYLKEHYTEKMTVKVYDNFSAVGSVVREVGHNEIQKVRISVAAGQLFGEGPDTIVLFGTGDSPATPGETALAIFFVQIFDPEPAPPPSSPIVAPAASAITLPRGPLLPGTLVSSFSIAGNGNNSGATLEVDSQDNIIGIGISDSTDFPVTADAPQSTLAGGTDITITKVNAALDTILFSTYLGGPGDDSAIDSALAPDGSLWILGSTTGAFPEVDPLQTGNNGVFDVFVTQLSPDLSTVLFSTLIGGSDLDLGRAIEIDSNGDVLIAGDTFSADFPTTANSLQGSLSGTSAGFLAKITGPLPDDVGSRRTISSSAFSTSVDTSAATTEPGDPTPSCGGGSRDNSVWYQFTPQTSGTIHLDTLESDYDTVVSVWTGAPGSFTQVACNDDFEASSNGGALVLAQTVSAGNSAVSFPATAGTTYFIMVSGQGGGGSLTITLSFQATANPLPPNTVGTIIPHSALGGGFLSRVFITNLSNNLNRIVINRVGQPGSVIDSASTFLEPAATAQVAASEAARTGDLTIEWFTIGSEADVASSLLFEFDSASLNLPENFRTAVGTLAAEPLSAFTVPVRVATVEVTVGLALADLSGNSNTVNLTLRDQNGATVAQDSLTLAAFEQTAFSLQDRAAFTDIILGVPEFIGSLAVETANPNQSVAAIVIGNNLRQLYALPVIPGVASSSGSTLRVPSTRSMVTRSRPAPGLAQAIPAGNFTTLIPHSAAGGGFLSRLFVVNLTGNTNNLTINRIGQDGSVVTTTDAMLAPAGTLMLPDDEAVRSEPLTVEWFAIGSEMPIGASLLFEFDSESLGLEENFLTAVGSLAADPLSSFTTPIRVATVDVTAGVALANPNDASTTVNLTLLSQGGTVVAQDSLTLGAFEQTAFSLQDRAAFSDIILGVPEFIGALAVTTTDANRPVAALVIGNNLGQLFALPVTPGVAQ